MANDTLRSNWRIAIYASVVLSVAVIIGNIVLYIVRPARHWPVLESLETLQVASLIPIAVVLHRLNRKSSLSIAVTVAGMIAILAAVAIDIGFVTELASFGKGFIGGPAFYTCQAAIVLWLLGANAIAWRAGTLPWSAIPLALLYPLWAVQFARWLETRGRT